MGEDSAQQTYSDHSEIQDTNIFQFIQNNQNINFSKNKVDSNVQRRNTANVFLDTFGDLGDDHNVVNKVSYSHNRHKSLVLPKVTQLSHTNISNYDENDDRYDDDLNDALSVTNFSVEDHTLVNFNVDPNNIFAKYSFIIDQNYVNEYYSLQNECDEIAVKIKNLDVGLQQAKVENEDYISPKYKDNIINILEKYEMSINNQKLLYTKIFESSMNANCNVEELLNQLDEDDQKSFDNSGDESFVSLNSNTNNSEKTKIYKLRKFVENKVQFIEEELIVPITHIKNSITNKHQDNLTLIKNTLGTHSQYILQQINEYDETISMISKQYFDKKDSITAMKKKLLDKILKIDNQKAIVYQKIVDDINDKLQIRADNLLKAKKHNELSDLLDTSRRLIAETNDTFKKDHKHLVSYTTQLKDMIDTRFSELKQNYDIKLKESKLQYEGELESQKNELNIIKSQLNEQNKLEIQKLHQELKIAHNKVSCLNEQVQDLTNQKVYLEVQYENLENRYNCEKELHNEILKSENRSDLPDVFDNEQLTLNDTKTLNNSINDSIEEVQLTLNKNTSKINVYSQNTLTPLYQTTIKHSIFAKPEYNTKSFNIFQNSANTIDEADTDLEGENLELKLKVQDLRNDIQELENQKSLLLCKIEDTNHIINKDQENISILNIQLDNANQTLIKKTEDLQNLEQEHEINIKELEKEIKHLQYSIDSQSKTSQQAITSLNRIIDDKSSKISNFRNEIKSYVAQIQDYDQTIALQKQNIDDKTELLREYEEANQKNQIELKRIQDELDIKTMLNIQYIQTQQEQEKTLNQLNQKLFLSEQQAFKLMSDLNHEKRNYLNLEKDKNSLYQVNNLFTTVKGIYTKNVLTSFNVLKYNHNNITNVKFENNVKYDSASNYTFTYINENANLKKDDNKNIIDVFEYTYDKDSIKNEDIKISINVIPPQDFSFDHSEIEEDKVYFDPMLHEFSGREEDDKIYFDQMFHEFSARDQDSFQSTPQNNIVETPINRDTVKIDIEDDKSINSGRSVDVNMQHDTLRLVVPTDTDLDLNIEEEKNIKELLSLGNIYVSAANIIGDDIQHLDKDNIDLYMLNLQNIKAAKSDPNANDLAPNLDEHVEQTIQDQIMQMIINDGVSIKNEDSVVSHDDEDIKSDETDVATSKQLEKSGEYDKHKLHNPYLGNPFSRRDFGEII